MYNALISLWALYVGITLLFLGSGMSFTLIVIRAGAEGFSPTQVGIMQTAYQVGWIVAALISAQLIRRVGHIRVFSAMTAASSALILLLLLNIHPLSWSVERFLMGVCTAAILVVCESWLNDMADNQTRGKVLALYTMLSWGAPVFGVWILRFNDTNSAFFFVVASVFISVAVIPMLLSVSRTPSLIEVERIGLKKLIKISPLGVTGALLSGACHGAFFATVALFGSLLELSVTQISTLGALSLAGGIITQWPIAALSDRFDRRKVLAAIAFVGAAVSLFYFTRPTDNVISLYWGVTLMSAALLSLYSLCISHANDHLKPSQIVPASSTLILVYGTGYAISPVIVSVLMNYSPANFFLSNGLLTLSLGGYVLYRMTRRDAVAIEDQGDTIPVATVSPYGSVVTAAEEWADEVETEQGKHDKVAQPH